MFQDSFLLHFLFNILRLPFVSFESMFQDFSSLSLTHKKLFAFPFTIFTFTPLYMCVVKVKNDIADESKEVLFFYYLFNFNLYIYYYFLFTIY